MLGPEAIVISRSAGGARLVSPQPWATEEASQDEPACTKDAQDVSAPRSSGVMRRSAGGPSEASSCGQLKTLVHMCVISKSATLSASSDDRLGVPAAVKRLDDTAMWQRHR